MRAAVIALALLLVAPTASADHHTTKKLGVVLICANGAWLRDGPGIRHEYMTTIKRGVVLPVLQIFELNWLNVVYEGKSGWVHRSMVKWSYQLSLHKNGKDPSCSDPLPQAS